MTNKQKEAYNEPEILRNILQRTLAGKKFRLDCGHHITFNAVLGNDLTVRNGKRLKVICTQCGY
jgi:hypothetical protein